MSADHWACIAFWIAYERFPCIDIRRKPYNTPIFRAKRSIASVHNAQLDLTKGCFERTSVPYGSPLDWWVQQMQERRQLHADFLFEPSKPTVLYVEDESDPPVTQTKTLGGKDEYLFWARKFLYILNNEKKVPDSLSQLPIHFELFNTALTKAWGKGGINGANSKRLNFRKKYWTPFLDSLNDYIQDMDGRKGVGIVFERDRKLYRYKVGGPQVGTGLLRGDC